MSATYPLPEESGELTELASRTRSQGRIVLTDHGRPVAAVVPLEDLNDLEAIDRAVIATAEAAMTTDKWIPHAKAMAMLGLDDLDDLGELE